MQPIQLPDHPRIVPAQKQQSTTALNLKGHLGYESVSTVSSSKRSPRFRVNWTAAALCLFVPVVLYALISGILTFHIRRSQPGLVCFAVICAGLIPIATGTQAMLLRKRRIYGGEAVQDTWHALLAWSTFVAWMFALVIGNHNYEVNSWQYYEWTNLKFYPEIEPQTHPGQLVIDAGPLVFTGQSRLNLNMSVSFRNVNTYCVAPIVSSGQPLATYDFWAAGVNCCGESVINASLRGAVAAGSDFQCGSDFNKTGGGGLRVLDDSLLPLYRLAVEQAKAKYHISANRPIFLTWSQDPLGEMNKYAEQALKTYVLSLLLFFGLQVFLVVSVLVALVHGYT